MPTKSAARREAYIRAALDRIRPQARLCARRSGTPGRQVVRLTSQTSSRNRIPIVISVVVGSRTRAVRAAEPFSTPVQKKSVAPVPKIPPVGTA